jgi:hypothetical protein
MEEKFGAGGALGRETSGEILLAARLRAVLEKLNPRHAGHRSRFRHDSLRRPDGPVDGAA